jgi:phage terminase small subunit
MTERRLKPVPVAARRPKVPSGLEGRAGELYAELGPGLEASGRLTDETRPLFVLWCRATATAEAAGADLESVDRPGARRGRPQRVRDPRWLGFRDATLLALRLGRDFGLTPASASKLKRPTPDPGEIGRLLS